MRCRTLLTLIEEMSHVGRAIRESHLYRDFLLCLLRELRPRLTLILTLPDVVMYTAAWAKQHAADAVVSPV